MDAGERATGTSDEHYNLIAVLYHALQGAETIEEYILDAEAAEDQRLVDFFQEAQDTYRWIAKRAKGMLGILEEVPPGGGISPGGISGGIPSPEEGGVSPGTISGGIPPHPDEVRMPAEEVPPTADVPRAALGEAPPPDEDVVTVPGGVRGGISPERPPREAPPAGLTEDTEAVDAPPDVPPPHIPVASPPDEAPGEPDRTTPERRAAGRAEGEQEDKGLIEKAIDKLTGREEPGREESDRRGQR